ncbi:hypothetical protein SKPI104516_08180 [Skermania piniformis]
MLTVLFCTALCIALMLRVVWLLAVEHPTEPPASHRQLPR